MRKIEELNGVASVDSDDLDNAAERLLYAAQIIIEWQNPNYSKDQLSVNHGTKEQFECLKNNQKLAIAMVELATLEKFRVDYACYQNSTHLLAQGLNARIDDLIESIDCAGAKATLDGL